MINEAIPAKVLESKGPRSFFRRAILALDLYGKPFNFRMKNGYSTHRSILGSCMTLLLIVIALIYGTN